MTQSNLTIGDIVAAYGSGKTTVELAKIYRVSIPTIRKHLIRAGVTMRNPHRGGPRRYDREWAQQVAQAYGKGEPIKTIADRLGVGQGTVWRALQMLGVTTRHNGVRASSIKIPTDPARLGYIAGLFDGEGNLQFKTKHNGNSVSCKVAIYSTTPEAVEWLVETIGGHLRWDHKRVSKGWKPIGIWEIYRAHDVYLLLTALLPYLIIKKPAAEKAIKFLREEQIHLETPSISDRQADRLDQEAEQNPA